jgi:predicted SPOUT superfamily RNA methylase MTH1
VFKPTGGRSHTLSIALPGSIIAKYELFHPLYLLSSDVFISAVTPDQKTSLAGQIARACAVFCVDEIVVFDDGQAATGPPEPNGYTAFTDPNFFLYHVLTYLETPPNLRKSLFPMHPDLRTAGALPSLDMPHHLRSDEWCEFREGITAGPGKRGSTLVDCGVGRKVSIPVELDSSTRVTVQLPKTMPNGDTISGDAVASDTPREQAGYYWGYQVRQAPSLGAIFTECPYDGGYDVSIGTSERGNSLDTLTDPHSAAHLAPNWNHLIVVFGGVAGLESALSADRELKAAGVIQAADVFDCWINLVPGQGSRTIRTEEAIWVGLTGVRQLVEQRNGK